MITSDAQPTAPSAQNDRPPMVDATQFARGGDACHGTLAPAQLERVAPELAEGGTQLRWEVAGSAWRDPAGRDRPQLHLRANGSLHIPCARCTGPVVVPVAIDRTVALAPDEESAEREDLEAEEFDVVAASNHFDLAQWLEDELLLVILEGHRHDDCVMNGVGTLSVDTMAGQSAVAARRNPFDVLRSLRSKP